MIAARIVRLRNPAARVPLWTVWFLVALAWQLLGMLVRPHRWARLMAPEFWANTIAIFIIGIDGWHS